jgi:hypothetical protein
MTSAGMFEHVCSTDFLAVNFLPLSLLRLSFLRLSYRVNHGCHDDNEGRASQVAPLKIAYDR